MALPLRALRAMFAQRSAHLVRRVPSVQAGQKIFLKAGLKQQRVNRMKSAVQGFIQKRKKIVRRTAIAGGIGGAMYVMGSRRVNQEQSPH